MERAPVTATQIREATRGDPVLSCVVYCILHGWPAEDSIPEELKIYYTKQEGERSVVGKQSKTSSKQVLMKLLNAKDDCKCLFLDHGIILFI